MLPRGHAMTLLCAMVLAGCGRTADSTTDRTDPASQAQQPDAAPIDDQDSNTAAVARRGRGVSDEACPSMEFPAFFDAFIERNAIQNAFTRWPLTSTSIDADAQPEPTPVTRRIARHQARFPLLSTVQGATQDGLEVSVRELGDRRAMVTYAKPDTDYQVIYRFELASDCWYLIGIQDDSM